MTWKSRARAAGANERMRIGLIGCGGRGRFDASLFSVRDDAEVAYVADPHQHRLAVAAKQFGSTSVGDWRFSQDTGRPVHRCRHRCDTRTLARPGDHPGLRGG